MAWYIFVRVAKCIPGINSQTGWLYYELHSLMPLRSCYRRTQSSGDLICFRNLVSSAKSRMELYLVEKGNS